MAIKVFVADDHHILRLGVVQLIECDSELELVGEASDGVEAYKSIISLKPDIAILDITMPEMTGLEVAHKIKKSGIPVETIILTMHDDEIFLNEALNIGVKGYVLKENTGDELISAIKAVASGKQYISKISSGILSDAKHKDQPQESQVSSIAKLTKMERKVLQLIAQAATSKEIANDLLISFRTVQNHRNNICAKIGVKGSNKLLAFAIKNISLL